VATYPITKQPIANVRDLIMALRKVGNSNAPVYLDCGNEYKFVGEVQVTDMMAPMVSMVHIVGRKSQPQTSE
jgi:hypothetical protein